MKHKEHPTFCNYSQTAFEFFSTTQETSNVCHNLQIDLWWKLIKNTLRRANKRTFCNLLNLRPPTKTTFRFCDHSQKMYIFSTAQWEHSKFWFIDNNVWMTKSTLIFATTRKQPSTFFDSSRNLQCVSPLTKWSNNDSEHLQTANCLTNPQTTAFR